MEEDFIFQFTTKERNRLALLEGYPNEGNAGVYAKKPLLMYVFDKKLDSSNARDEINVYDSSGAMIDKVTRSVKINKIGDPYGDFYFELSKPLIAGNSYTVKIGSNLKDEAGVKFVEPLEIHFTASEVLVENKTVIDDFEAVSYTHLYVWSDGVNLYIFRNNKTEILNPVDGANGYVWATVSPDQKMILFTAAAKGTFVCNLNGEIVADLGFLNAPAWYGNDYVVGMQDRDDGSFVTESKIVMKNLKGTVEKVLSTPEQIAMYPTASEKAAKISYNTTAGDIWVVELKVKERGFFSRLFGR